jgi:UDP-N-acetylmuramate:L-alanyl-gamma-D-glutamyl-meso-diaminopimelate ligase
MQKPRALRPGDRLAVVSPASPFNRDEFDLGIDEIRRLGFEPVFDDTVFARQRYVSGPPELRAAAIRTAWRDPSIAGLVGVRGGFGSAQVLPLLDRDEARRACKPFIGYSDLTSILTFLTLGCDLVAFHGPMLDRRLSRGAEGYDIDSFTRALCRREPMGELVPAGLESIRDGEAAGTLLGGTLTQLLASFGTPFAFAPPPGYVLFLDEVGERPYRLDRMVTQLRQAGCWRAPARSSSASCRIVTSPEEADSTRGGGRLVSPIFRSGRHRVSVRSYGGARHDTAVWRHLSRCRGSAAACHRRGISRPMNQTIHLIGICGTAMATLAAMLKRKGFTVRGSDQDVYPPMSDFLHAEGIPALVGYRPEHISADLDLVVVGNAISRGNPELEEVLDRKIRYCSLPEAIREHFLWGARSIVVAGTHGKTTTTAMIGWLLTHGGVDPSVLVGGIVRNFGEQGSSYRLGLGRDFVIEGDEYDSAFFDKTAKFLKYLPDIAIVNNVEFDHADIYKDLEAVTLAFRRLINLVPRRGLLLVGADSPGARALADAAKSRMETFGTADATPSLDWQAHDLEPTCDTTRFKVRRHGSPFGSFEVPMVGTHNVRNALAAIAVATETGVGVDRIVEGLRALPASNAGSKSWAWPTASPSTTISRTIRRRWPKRSRRSAPPIPRRGSGRCSSRAPLLRAGACSRMISRAPSRAQTRCCWRQSSDRRCRMTSACRSRNWSGTSSHVVSGRAKPRRSTRSCRWSSVSIGLAISSC